jgi:hypothetical protein
MQDKSVASLRLPMYRPEESCTGWDGRIHIRIAVESGKGWLPHLEEAGEEER